MAGDSGPIDHLEMKNFTGFANFCGGTGAANCT